MTAHNYRRRSSQALPTHQLDSVVQCFRDWHPYDEGRSVRGERAALARISECLGAAANCILALSAGDPDLAGETPIRAAWRRIDIVMAERGSRRPSVSGDDAVDALISWSTAAKIAERKIPSTRFNNSAALIAAGRLWALRDSHQFKRSTYIDGQPVTELVTAAKLAKVRLTRDAAQKALKITNKSRAASDAK